jgi:hypothetical protein
MEMVAHEAVGEDVYPTKLGVPADQASEVLLLNVAENEPSIHDAGHAVVKTARSFERGGDAARSHEVFAS